MNSKEILSLSFEALIDRKVRSALTILMVVVGSTLMVALDGLTAGFGGYIEKQFSSLATNVLTLSTSQNIQQGPGFGGGPPAAPKIIFNSAVVSKVKSLPLVNDVVSIYSGQITLESEGKSNDVSVLSIDPQKILLIAPTLEIGRASCRERV